MADTQGIWWLASYPKSGSTWARQVINAAVTGFPPAINSAWQYVCGDFGVQLYGHTAAIPVEQMDDRDLLAYRLAALRNHLAIFPHRDAAFKTHHACLTVHDVPLIPAWLTKSAVYIVRDPRDVCVSLSKHLGKTIDETIDMMEHENAGICVDKTRWRHYLSTWSTHVESWLDEDNPIQAACVRYEDMHETPMKAFRKILDFMGLPQITDIALAQAISRCRIDKLRDQEDKLGFREGSKRTERFFGNGKAGGWRDVLTDQQAARIETTHGEIMQQLGYEPSTSLVRS